VRKYKITRNPLKGLPISEVIRPIPELLQLISKFTGMKKPKSQKLFYMYSFILIITKIKKSLALFIRHLQTKHILDFRHYNKYSTCSRERNLIRKKINGKVGKPTFLRSIDEVPNRRVPKSKTLSCRSYVSFPL